MRNALKIIHNVFRIRQRQFLGSGFNRFLNQDCNRLAFLFCSIFLSAFDIMVIPAKISHVVLVLTVCISSVLGTPLTSPLKRRKMSNCTGNTRFPPLSPENNNLDAAQLVQYNYLLNVTKETFGDLIVTENADGSLAGPFNELL